MKLIDNHEDCFYFGREIQILQVYHNGDIFSVCLADKPNISFVLSRDKIEFRY